MKGYKHKTSLTLVEMLIVVAIIAILAAIVIGIAARINSKSKEQLTENTIAILNAALGEFGDYGYNYKVSTAASEDERDFYRSLEFPLDCNDFDEGQLRDALRNALGATNVSISSGDHDPNYSGSEALYFFLSRVPESRKTLDKIDGSLITNEDSDGVRIVINIDGKEYPLLRIIDPWGTTLRYDYYDEQPPPLSSYDIKDMEESKKVFPVITSAGPDKSFGTADDIAGR